MIIKIISYVLSVKVKAKNIIPIIISNKPLNMGFLNNAIFLLYKKCIFNFNIKYYLIKITCQSVSI